MLLCRKLGVMLLVLSVLFFVQSRTLSDESGIDRIKIGLALSGGGARGAAHIGVLKVLEDNRIPIDYIAGTSMGSIVGGLYATGMSPEQITEAVTSMDWDGVFQDLPSRQERSFRRKRDDDLFLVKTKPGIDRGGLKLPPGLVQGQKIDLALARFTRHASKIDVFDDFRIPFRAVATDIVTGEPVVLGKGNLAHAIRASMSVPAAFSPINIEGRRLVDGGVANNLPIDVVRAMGADVVIAVDISTPLLNEDQVDSVLSITVQLTGILTRRNTKQQISTLTDADVLLVPDLGDITSNDFNRAVEAIPSGRTAAEQNLTRLRRYSLLPEAYQNYLAGLTLVKKESVPSVDFVRLDNQSRIKDSMVLSRVYNTRVGQPFSIANAERDVGRIYGLDLFENVGYRLVEEGDDTGVEFYIQERGWGPNYLQVGANYDGNTKGDNLFNLAVSTLFAGLNSSRGELRLGAQIGEEPYALADYHQPFGSRGMWFTNVKAIYGSAVTSIFENNKSIADVEVTEKMIEGSVGRELGTWGEVRAGLRYSDGDIGVRVGDPAIIPSINFQRGEFFLDFFVDELDSFHFPREGYIAKANWLASRGGLGADTDFEQLSLNGALTRSWGRHTLIGNLEYKSTISGTAPIQNLYSAGGFLNLSGLNSNEFSGQHFGLMSGVYYRRLGKSRIFPLYAGASLEAGNVFQDHSDVSFSNLIIAGSIFISADTPAGPLYLAYGHTEGGTNSMYIFLGRPF